MLKLESAFFMFISIKNLQKKVIYGKIYLYSGKNQRGIEMELLVVIYILIFIVFALILYAVMQMKLLGIKVKDFWDFIEANQMLDKLCNFAKQYQRMSPQEQVIYLSEAEKIFTAFDKMPSELWEDEYDKYKQVLKKYKDIKMFRWESN
jgi:hypothetical protein